MSWIRSISIRWRITIGSVLVALVFLSAAVIIFRTQVESILSSSTTVVLTHDAAPFVAQIADSATPVVRMPGRGQLVAVIDSSETIIQTNLPKGIQSQLAEVRLLSNGVHTVNDGDDQYRVLLQTVSTANGTWTVITARNLDSALLSLDRITRALIVGGIVLVAGFGIASWILTGAALRPVGRMRRHAEALVAEGSTQPLPVGRAKDEMFALATTLNEFIAEVHQSVDRERQLVSDASHELRTPLAILMAQLELAHLVSGDAVALEAEIVTAQASAARLSALANGLLQLSELESHAPDTSSSWNDLVAELADSIDQTRLIAVAQNITIDFDVSDDPFDGRYRIAASNFGRIVTNLTTNAVNALTSRESLDDGGTVRLALRHSGVEMLLTVVDSGAGMPDEFLAVAFDRFTRPDAARAQQSGGSGLGLAIVHAIVSAAHGSVTLSNAAGFTVTVSLPQL